MSYSLSNQSLQYVVQEALRWEPQLQGTQFGVIANDGVITLTGVTDSYYKKMEAEKIAKNIAGVRALIERIAVVVQDDHQLTDEEIGAKILSIYQSSFTIPDHKIKVTIENGWVTLEGKVHWNYQKHAAEDALHTIQGIRGISNLIQTQTNRDSEIKKEFIEKALHDSALLHDSSIEVEVNNRRVTLSGHVNTLYEKEEAERLAWNAKGVIAVENALTLSTQIVNTHDYECK
jgi:osmotically-inducible protein OsmY